MGGERDRRLLEKEYGGISVHVSCSYIALEWDLDCCIRGEKMAKSGSVFLSVK